MTTRGGCGRGSSAGPAARSGLIRLASFLVVAVLFAACGPGEEAPFERPPDGAIEIEGELYPLGLGSNCWRGDEGRAALCVDAIGIMTAPPYARSVPGTDVLLAGELAAAEIPIASAQLWPAPAEPVETGPGWEAWQPPQVGVSELDVADAALTLPDDLDAGRYLIAINVHEAEFGSSATYGAIVTIR